MAAVPTIEECFGVPKSSERPIDVPNDIIAARSSAVSAERFLNLASDHTKRGTSSSNDLGSSPSLRANEKRNSV